MIKVDRKVPIPPPSHGVCGHAKYPWALLAVGDSFFVAKPRPKFQRQVSFEGASRGIKLLTRRLKGGIRVWRVK